MRCSRTTFLVSPVLIFFFVTMHAAAQQTVSRYVSPGSQIAIDLKADYFDSGTGSATITKGALRGIAVADGTKIIYNPLNLRDGYDRVVAQLGSNQKHILTIDFVVGEPAIAESEIYATLGELLFKLLVVAIFLEVALTTVFRNRRFQMVNNFAGIKTLISIIVAGVVVIVFRLNIFGQVVEAIQDRTFDTPFPIAISYMVTALIVAGGSGTVYELYTRLGIRKPRSSGESGAVLQGDGRLVVEIARNAVAASVPVNVILDKELIGVLPPNQTRFGDNGGVQVRSGAYVLKLTSNDVDGKPVENERNIGIEPGKTLIVKTTI